MTNNESELLLEMLKALADESRLTMLRFLNEREHTVGDLASRVGLSEPTVSHHLAKLRQSEMVTLRMAGNQRFYRINIDGLDHFKFLVSRLEEMPPEPEPIVSDDSWILELDLPEYDQKVLRDYTVNGQIEQLPSKQKKLLVVLRWLATMFQPDTFYTEKEVNEIISAVHEADYVGLWRDLISWGYLRRERGGGRYWLTPADEV
jgi:DNA-binding transcriptional ArsR family regulator